MLDLKVVEFQPSAVGTTETKSIHRTRKGQRIRAVSLKRLIVADGATTSTWDVGDATTAGGFLSSIDTEGTSGDLVDGSGTYLSNAGGKLYTAVTSIQIKYTAGATPGSTAPRCAVTLEIEQIWPSL